MPVSERTCCASNPARSWAARVLLSRIEPKGYGFDAEGVEGTWRVLGGKRYFLVLNRKGKWKQDVRMKLAGVADGKAKVMFENREVEVRNGELVDDFAGFEARVYVVE